MTGAVQVIDAHQHVWDPALPWHRWPDASLPAIHRAFLPDALAAELVRNGISGTLLVQAQPVDAETDWMLDLADRTPSIRGVVGWMDMKAPDTPARIASLARRPKLRGVRPMLQDLSPDWILDPAADAALRALAAHDLVFDALVRPAHLPALVELAGRHPDLRIVIDHAAKPDRGDAAAPGWQEDMARLADRPNLFCKLSGLVTEIGPGWSPDQLRPTVECLLGLFGPDRLIWGSDWPVLLLASEYRPWLEAARALVPAGAHAAVFGGTARAVYRLAEPPSRA